MDRKPWQVEGSHRGGSNEGRRSDRFERSDRRSDRRDSNRGGFGRDERSDRRFGGDRGGQRRGGFGGDRRFADKPQFGVRSGPRARAMETRRYAERSEFEKNAMVRLAPDVAMYFESARQVNEVLRGLIALQSQMKIKKQEEAKPEVTEQEAQVLFTNDVFDDDESPEYGVAQETSKE